MKKLLLALLLVTACANDRSAEIITPAPVPKVTKEKIK